MYHDVSIAKRMRFGERRSKHFQRYIFFSNRFGCIIDVLQFGMGKWNISSCNKTTGNVIFLPYDKIIVCVWCSFQVRGYGRILSIEATRSKARSGKLSTCITYSDCVLSPPGNSSCQADGLQSAALEQRNIMVTEREFLFLDLLHSQYQTNCICTLRWKPLANQCVYVPRNLVCQ